MIAPEIRRWVALGVLIVVLLFAGAVLTMCNARKEAAQARSEAKVAGGRTVSAVEAINEIGKLGERSDSTDLEVEEAKNAILKADPDERDRVFRHRVCVLQHRPDCDRLL